MANRIHRTRIDDLTSVGEELSEEHLRLVSGSAGKKSSGSGREGNGTSTFVGLTYVAAANGAGQCEADDDFD
jgi:hypothetical protein